MLLPLLRPRKRIQPLVVLAQSLSVAAGDLAAGQQALIRGRRWVVGAPPATALAPFVLPFHRGQGKVLEWTPDFFVQGVDWGDHALLSEAPVAQQVTWPHPVLLLDVGVVVFVVGSRAGDVDRLAAVLAVAQVNAN